MQITDLLGSSQRCLVRSLNRGFLYYFNLGIFIANDLPGHSGVWLLFNSSVLTKQTFIARCISLLLLECYACTKPLVKTLRIFNDGVDKLLKRVGVI
jgi:hypothetical protein